LAEEVAYRIEGVVVVEAVVVDQNLVLKGHYLRTTSPSDLSVLVLVSILLHSMPILLRSAP